MRIFHTTPWDLTELFSSALKFWHTENAPMLFWPQQGRAFPSRAVQEQQLQPSPHFDDLELTGSTRLGGFHSQRVKTTALLQALVLSLCKSNRIYLRDLGVKEISYDCWENSEQEGLDFVSLFIKYLRRNTLSEHGRTFHDDRKRKCPLPLAKKIP